MRATITQQEIPDWATGTPTLSVHGFQLAAYEAGSSEQIIDMEREEYIALKLHLAKMRGYEVTELDEEQIEAPTIAPSAASKRETLVVGIAIAATYFGYDLGDHAYAGCSVEYSELLLKDADGDLITSHKEAEEFGCPVNVIINDETDKETAVRLLRKIADVIGKNGICRDEYAVHTRNPVIDQLGVLRARIIAAGGRVTGGEAVTPPE